MTRVKSLCFDMWNDQAGFVLTAELVLISTLLVIGLIVGMTSVQTAVVGELEDVGTAIGSLNQSYYYNGMISRSTLRDCGIKSYTAGSAFTDLKDECDADFACHAFGDFGTAPAPEGARHSKKHHAPPMRDHQKSRDSHKHPEKSPKA